MFRQFLLLIFIVQSSILFSEVDYENINKKNQYANNLYNEDKFLEANDIYKELAKDIKSRDLYYNLATSYKAIGSNSYAVAWYERAIKINPFDFESIKNIKEINASYNYNFIFVIIYYVAIFLFILSFILFIIKRKLFITIFLIIFFISSFISYNLFNRDYVVVINNSPLYNGMSVRSDKVIDLKDGSKLRILEERESWYYIKFNQYKGWINIENTVKI